MEIRAVPGQRKVEVKKDGFKTFGEVVTVKTDGSEEVTVRLEPLVADRLPNEDRVTSKTSRGEDPVLKNEVVSSRSMQDDAGASEFVPLFNGKDLSGWKTHPSQPGQWRVQGGVLIGSGPAASHLYSVRDDYKDFHLRVEARINDGGNSGVYFRSAFGPIWPSINPTWPDGYEAQINSTHWNQQDRTGSLRGGPDGVPVVMVRDSPVPLRQWFDLYVIADGNRVVVMVNGRVTVEYIDENRLYTSGHIVLQSSSAMMQTDPQTVVEFRNIEIKELSGSGGMSGPPTSTVESRAGARAKGGFQPLFQGKDMTAWEGLNEYWRIQDGSLIGSPPPRRPLNSAVGVWLRSAKVFDRKAFRRG